MKCNDCLKEISEKEYYNKSIEGVCQKCRQRIAQIKYENKKFGTNKEYIPLRLKDSKKIINKKDNKVVTTTKVINQEKKNEKIYDEKIEKIVLEDIENTFKAHSITINHKEVPPFKVFMDMFCSLIDINNGYMSQYKKAEDVFNMMEGDYQHAYEDAKTPEIFAERSKMFRCLLDQRRSVKNGLGQYSKIVNMLEDIVRKNPKILEMALTSKEELEKIILSQDEHHYKARASELIAKEDFCIGKKDMSERGTYHVSVPIFGYYGTLTTPYLFERNTFAENSQDAIDSIREYLKQKFPKCKYKLSDFKTEKITEKVCS